MSVDDIADFSKQRRNLIIVSGVLLLHDVLGIDYKNFKIFGMEITKGENITWVIWAMWIYFFIRYFNLFFEQESTYKTPILKQLHQYEDVYCKNRYLKKHPTQYPENVEISPYRRSSLWRPKLEIYDRAREYRNIRIFGSLRKRTILFFLIRAKFHYIFKTHYFFEYYFPILFSLPPLIIVIYKNLGVFVPWW
ncbi:MAG: hypothetical protein R3D88_02540 [Alphaproteobacteria bacterium]|nr:hypothetical protein [Alphaproteobacteria bacterium]